MAKLNDINLYYALVDVDGTIKDLVKESTNALEKAMEYMGRVNTKRRGKFVLWLNKFNMYIVKLGILPTNKFMQNILISAYALLLFKSPKKFVSKYFEVYNKEEVFFDDAKDIVETLYNKDLVVCVLSKNMQNQSILDARKYTESTKFLKYISKTYIGEKVTAKYFLYKSFMRNRCIFNYEVVIVGDNFIDDILPAMLLGTKVVWCNKYNSKLKQFFIAILKFFSKKVFDERQISEL